MCGILTPSGGRVIVDGLTPTRQRRQLARRIGVVFGQRTQLRTFLRELNRAKGTTVILTTHDLDDIAELCHRLLIIDHGQTIYDGTVEGLRRRYGTTRVLVVDLREDAEVVVEGARVVRAEGHRRWLEFGRDEVSAAELIARVMADHEVVDLTLEEPDIEDIVRRIYRGEAGPREGDAERREGKAGEPGQAEPREAGPGKPAEAGPGEPAPGAAGASGGR